MHSSNKGLKGSSELGRMYMFLQDGKNLIEKLLLMEVVKFEGGVHFVDNGMFVDKSWELIHNGSNKVSIICEANMDVIARDDLMLIVQACVESSGNTIDSDSSHSMSNIGSVRDGLST